MEHFRLMGAMMELAKRTTFDDELPLVAVELDHMAFDATFGAAGGAEVVADFVGVVEPIAYWEIHGPVVVGVGDVSEYKVGESLSVGDLDISKNKNVEVLTPADISVLHVLAHSKMKAEVTEEEVGESVEATETSKAS